MIGVDGISWSSPELYKCISKGMLSGVLTGREGRPKHLVQKASFLLYIYIEASRHNECYVIECGVLDIPFSAVLFNYIFLCLDCNID